jgi:hypothetical protein
MTKMAGGLSNRNRTRGTSLSISYKFIAFLLDKTILHGMGFRETKNTLAREFTLFIINHNKSLRDL